VKENRHRLGNIIGKSKPMQEIYSQILEASTSNAGVVLYGESGTGKELIARTIHDMSARGQGTFFTINCGAIPENIFESEFFGHRKGAYTGAHEDKRGFFDLANRGTLFLDEVSELSLSMQVKLLRAIEGYGYTPVGDTRTRYSDVRIIAATNENLRGLVKTGKMREDFFFRLHIIPIYVPPLRDRKEDLPMLINHFLRLFDGGKKPTALPGRVINIILDHNWPGNVRELQNVLHRYMTFKKLDFMDPFEISGEEKTKPFSNLTLRKEENSAGGHDWPLDLRAELKKHEKRLLLEAMDYFKYNRRLVSENLGLPLRTLSRKLKEHGLI
jgi:transcriptional regulator with PAS, ATPase and Fis domain